MAAICVVNAPRAGDVIVTCGGPSIEAGVVTGAVVTDELLGFQVGEGPGSVLTDRVVEVLGATAVMASVPPPPPPPLQPAPIPRRPRRASVPCRPSFMAAPFSVRRIWRLVSS